MMRWRIECSSSRLGGLRPEKIYVYELQAPYRDHQLRARHPHQVEAFQGQVSEIVLTIETRPSRGYFAAGWQENVQPFRDFLTELRRSSAKCRVVEIDYTGGQDRTSQNEFFGGFIPPLKDFRGGLRPGE